MILPIVKFVALGIAIFFVAWIIFINIMPYSKTYKEKPLLQKLLLLLLFVVGWVLDVVFNIVFGTVLFRELPKELMLTHRLIRIINTQDEDSFNFKIAMFICKKLLEPHDPDHCGLEKFKDV